MQTIDEKLDTAFQLYNNKQYDMAEELTREVITILPGHGDALYLLGLIAYQAGALEPAEKLLYQAVQLYPEQKSYTTALASILQKQHRFDEALSFYEKYPDDAEVLSHMGFIYIKKNQLDFANSYFNKALEINPQNASAYVGLSMVFDKQNQYENALNILQQGEKHTQSSELSYHLARQKMHNGNYQEALIDINKALQNESLPAFYHQKGLILEQLSDYPTAILCYEAAIQKNPYLADAYMQLGGIYLMQNDMKKGEDYLKRALSINNNLLIAHHNLATLLSRQNRQHEALEHLRQALIIDNNHLSSLYNLAIILENMGEYNEALGLYFNILTIDSDFENTSFRIAATLDLLAKSGKEGKKQATTFATGWVKNFPDDVVGQVSQAGLVKKSVPHDIFNQYTLKLYENFAISYDETMQNIKSTVLEVIGENTPFNATDKILDLACGTGAFALQLKQPIKQLIGIDLSPKMLEIAKIQAGYTDFVCMDAIKYLKTTKATFNTIIAAELTCYLPDLNDLFSSIAPHLEKKGQFIVSIETGAGDKPLLTPAGRYVFSPSYVENIIQSTGLVIDKKIDTILRYEHNKPVSGIIYYIKRAMP